MWCAARHLEILNVTLDEDQVCVELVELNFDRSNKNGYGHLVYALFLLFLLRWGLSLLSYVKTLKQLKLLFHKIYVLSSN